MSAPFAQTVTASLPLSGLPGPRGWPVLGNALQIKPEAFHRQLEAWAQQYGGKFRFRIASRQFLAITDPEAIASVLRQRPEAFRRTARLEQVAKDLGFQGLFSANGEAWRRQRPMVLAGLDPAHIRTYLPAIIDVTDRLRSRWMAAAGEGRPVDLLADLMRYTVDVTTSLAFGRNLNTLEEGDETAIQQHLNVIFPALFRRVLAPVDLSRWLDRKTPVHVEALRKAVLAFIADARRQLEETPALRDRPENLIQALIAARDRPETNITDEDVAGNVLTMLLAGEDTTANTLAWLIWLLYRNPSALQEARGEVDHVVGTHGMVASIEQLSALDELEACANEAMRLKPVAPIIINQALQDVVVAGVLVPKDALVVCVMRPAACDPDNFSDPERFSPARWRNGSSGGDGRKSLSSAKRVVMPFGAGARICPGRYLALAEIKMVAAMLLANFELEQVGVPSGDEPVEQLKLTMAPVGLRMKLRKRS
jgi:cytochrome P450